MGKLRSEKVEIGKKIAERLSGASASILAEYRGLTAEDLSGFRKELRKNGCEFHVVKKSYY